LYILDTNVISELRRRHPHGAVLEWFREAADAELHLSAATIGEIQAGIELTRNHDAARAVELQSWLDQIEATYNVLPMDGRAFRLWARLMHGRSNDLIEDAMVAATAKLHNLTVVTRNVRDFTDFGVSILNPFQSHRRP